MAFDKANTVKMTTSKGTFVWPKLTEPDYGTKDYPKPEGEYSVKLRFSASDPAFLTFQAKLQPFIDEAIENGQTTFDAIPLGTGRRTSLRRSRSTTSFQTVFDKDTGEETGEVEVKLAMKAGGVIKKGPKAGKAWSRKPDLFDATGRKIGKGVAIWGGSTGKVSFSFNKGGYFIPASAAVGLRLSLEAGTSIYV